MSRAPVIHGLYSYVQISGVWDTGNRELPVIPTPGVPDTGEMQIAGVPNTGEMQIASVPTPVKCEMPVFGIPEICTTFIVENIAGVRDNGEI